MGGGRLVEVIALALIVVAAIVLVRAALEGVWLIGPDGLPVSTDFNAFWAAGYVAAHGDAASAYDWNALQAVLERHHPKSFAHRFDFFYPPSYFLAIAPLGLLPYVWAAALWIGVTLLAYLAAVRAILPTRVAILAALGAPSVLWAISVGQNGLLTAALLGGALALLDKRPVVAGALIGMLAFKPQLGVLIPFLLVAAARWTTFAAAAATTVMLALLAALLFGWATYAVFLDAFAAGGDQLLGVGALPWFKMQSVYGMARSLGLSGAQAWVAHGAAAAGAALATLRLWRSDTRFEIKAAALPVAALAISPHVCIYDLTIVTITLVFLMRDWVSRAPRVAEQVTLCLALILPAAFPILGFPIGPFVYALLAALIGWRWWDETPRLWGVVSTKA